MSTAVMKRDLVAEFRHQIVTREEDFRAALPSHIPFDKYRRVVMTAVAQDPDLLSADRLSLLQSCMLCAQDGLLPDKREAALVIYNTKVKRDGREEWIKAAQYIPMVAGVLKRARNSGQIAYIGAQLVYSSDRFRWWMDQDGWHLEHEPDVFAEDRGRLLGAYATATLKDGTVDVEVMSVADINRIRERSKSKDKGPWQTDTGEMMRKTALKRLCKRLPMNADVEALLSRDTVIESEPAPPRPTLADYRPAAAPQIEDHSDHGDDEPGGDHEHGGEDSAPGDEITVSDEYGNVEYVGFDRQQALSVLQKLRAACKDAASVDVLSEHNADLWPDLPK